MHKPSIQIELHKPCTENWSAMSPAHQGHFCSNCNKTVFDFSLLSDAELIIYIAKNPRGCGRFRADQLETTITTPGQKQIGPTLLSRFVAAVLFLSAPNFLKAQNKVPLSQEDRPAKKMDKHIPETKSLPDETNTISGWVIDELTENPIRFAKISLSDSTVHTISDSAGFFRLEIPLALISDTLRFSIQDDSHESRYIAITRNQLPYTTNFKLNPNLNRVGGYVTGIRIDEAMPKWWQFRKRYQASHNQNK
jgi:hypothetical protein